MKRGVPGDGDIVGGAGHAREKGRVGRTRGEGPEGTAAEGVVLQDEDRGFVGGGGRSTEKSLSGRSSVPMLEETRATKGSTEGNAGGVVLDSPARHRWVMERAFLEVERVPGKVASLAFSSGGMGGVRRNVCTIMPVDVTHCGGFWS